MTASGRWYLGAITMLQASFLTAENAKEMLKVWIGISMAGVIMEDISVRHPEGFIPVCKHPVTDNCPACSTGSSFRRRFLLHLQITPTV
jgi:hypothetical protein